MKKLFIVTGEYSGSMHAVKVVECLKAKYPEIEIEKSYISNITSICDVYEALSSERDYKKNLSKDECIKIMKKIAFDKYLFNEFLKFENVVEKEGTNN